MNPVNKKDNKCFQCAVTAALNHDDWEKFKKNNPTIDLNVSYTKKDKIYPAYVLKHN